MMRDLALAHLTLETATPAEVVTAAVVVVSAAEAANAPAATCPVG